MKKVRRGRSLGSTGDRAGWQGRLTQGFCCRAGEETGALELMEQREKKRAAADYLVLLQAWLPNFFISLNVCVVFLGLSIEGIISC